MMPIEAWAGLRWRYVSRHPTSLSFDLLLASDVVRAMYSSETSL